MTIPTWNGLPIPWVARREGEEPPRSVGPGGGFATTRSVITDRPIVTLEHPALEVDVHGWRWIPEPDEVPWGVKPYFAQLHAGRQRACMDERRCQVCSCRMRDVTTWMVTPSDLETVIAGRIVTSHAPVCRACMDVVTAVCPSHRRMAWTRIEAREYMPVGVYGDVYRPDDHGELTESNVFVTPLSEWAGCTIARQRVVALGDWTKIA